MTADANRVFLTAAAALKYWRQYPNATTFDCLPPHVQDYLRNAVMADIQSPKLLHPSDVRDVDCPKDHPAYPLYLESMDPKAWADAMIKAGVGPYDRAELIEWFSFALYTAHRQGLGDAL